VQPLVALGIWQYAQAQATPIKQIHISDQGHFGKTRLSAKKEGVDALGYVITARDLEAVVADLVKQAGIVQICPARVIGVAADDQFAHISGKSLLHNCFNISNGFRNCIR
jgi:2-octaprenyl-6-methoxyphenol hydroxylase